MPDQPQKHVAWIWWPFQALWNFLATILNLIGRVAATAIGVVFMIIGLVLTVTLVAAPVGIPLVILGFLLMLRSIF
ncbi:MAG: hypothetical protein ONB11_02170 [candidate division KSB1 bacterium]|nr:hypothetical protein [candidate division KSB1 bacterium]